MPVIEVLFDDLQSLVGVDLPRSLHELTELLSYIKGEAVSLQGNSLSIEVKDGNRPDLWCVEGVARELRGTLEIEEGLKEYSINGFSGVRVEVDPRLGEIRPYIGGSVVRNVYLKDDVIRELMHLQDKLDQTYGRKRRRASIGLYNYSLITPPLKYCVAGPEEVRFVPLGYEVEMALREIIETHPKGIEYGYIIKEHKLWPILIDSRGKVLSTPPIINSNDLGRLTPGVKDVFVEVTGTNYRTVLNTLTIVTLSLADRGEGIFSVEIHYPYGERGSILTPEFVTEVVSLDLKYVNRVLGLNLGGEAILKLLKKARYDAKWSGGDIVEVTIPCYRIDVMHQLDIVEDIAIKFGYNNFEPRWPKQITFGRISEIEAFSDLAREIIIGLGFQEIMSFTLTNKEKLFRKMNLEEERVVEILNPTSSRFTCVRSWLIPSLMEFLSKNTGVEYPQKIFEVGECSVPDNANETGARDVRSIACLIAHSNSSFSEAKADLEALSINMGFKYELVEAAHRSFIEGRAGSIVVNGRMVGILGELNPIVLEMWGLENPVAGFELNLSELMDLI